jgi:hypothetical protein
MEKKIKDYDDFNDTIDEFKDDFLINSGMDEQPGAKFKHALKGLFVAMYSCAGDDADDCKIEFLSSKPYIKVKLGKMKEEDHKYFDHVFKCFEKLGEEMDEILYKQMPPLLKSSIDAVFEFNEVSNKAK